MLLGLPSAYAAYSKGLFVFDTNDTLHHIQLPPLRGPQSMKNRTSVFLVLITASVIADAQDKPTWAQNFVPGSFTRLSVPDDRVSEGDVKSLTDLMRSVDRMVGSLAPLGRPEAT